MNIVMEGQSQPLSPRQLELQVCLSQRRIDKINAILKSGVQAPIDNTVDAETVEVISRLYDTSLSDADISCGIGILEMLLELEGLKPLLNLMKSASYSMALRQRAAKAISVIGNNYVENDLRALLSSPSPDLRHLAEIALGTRSMTP
jgi:HEAT repeat protein